MTQFSHYSAKLSISLTFQESPFIHLVSVLQYRANNINTNNINLGIYYFYYCTGILIQKLLNFEMMFNSLKHLFISILYSLLFLPFHRMHFYIKLKIRLVIIKKINSSALFTDILTLFCYPRVYKRFESYSTVNHISSLQQNSAHQILVQDSTSQTLPSMELAVHFLLFLVRVALPKQKQMIRMNFQMESTVLWPQTATFLMLFMSSKNPSCCSDPTLKNKLSHNR